MPVWSSVRRSDFILNSFTQNLENNNVYVPPLLGYDFFNNKNYIEIEAVLIAYCNDEDSDIISYHNGNSFNDWKDWANNTSTIIEMEISCVQDFQIGPAFLFVYDTCSVFAYFEIKITEIDYNSRRIKIQYFDLVGSSLINLNVNWGGKNKVFIFQNITELINQEKSIFFINDNFQNNSKFNRFTFTNYNIKHAGATFVTKQQSSNQVTFTPNVCNLKYVTNYYVFRCFFTNYHALQNAITDNINACLNYTNEYNLRQTVGLYLSEDNNVPFNSFEVRTSYPNKSHINSICWTGSYPVLTRAGNNVVLEFTDATLPNINIIGAYTVTINDESVFQDQSYDYLFQHTITQTLNQVTPTQWQGFYFSPSVFRYKYLVGCVVFFDASINEYYTIFSNIIGLQENEFDLVCNIELSSDNVIRPLDSVLFLGFVDLLQRNRDFDSYITTSMNLSVFVKGRLNSITNDIILYSKNVRLNNSVGTVGNEAYYNINQNYNTIYYSFASGRCLSDFTSTIQNNARQTQAEGGVGVYFSPPFTFLLYVIMPVRALSFINQSNFYQGTHNALFSQAHINSYQNMYAEIIFNNNNEIIKGTIPITVSNFLDYSSLNQVSIVYENDDEIVFQLPPSATSNSFIISLHKNEITENPIARVYKVVQDYYFLNGLTTNTFVSNIPNVFSNNALTYLPSQNRIVLNKTNLIEDKYCVYFRILVNPLNANRDIAELYCFRKTIKRDKNFLVIRNNYCCPFFYIPSDKAYKIITLDDPNNYNLSSLFTQTAEDFYVSVTNNSVFWQEKCFSLLDYCQVIAINSIDEMPNGYVLIDVYYKFLNPTSTIPQIVNLNTLYSFEGVVYESGIDLEREFFISSTSLNKRRIYDFTNKRYTIKLLANASCQYNAIMNIIKYAEHIKCTQKQENMFINTPSLFIDKETINIEYKGNYYLITFEASESRLPKPTYYA